MDTGFYRVVRAGANFFGITNGQVFSGLVSLPVEIGLSNPLDVPMSVALAPISSNGQATNAQPIIVSPAQPSELEKLGSSLEKKIEELRLQSVEDFNKLLNRLRPYGTLQNTRDVYVQRRTNSAGGMAAKQAEEQAMMKTTQAAMEESTGDGGMAPSVNEWLNSESWFSIVHAHGSIGSVG